MKHLSGASEKHSLPSILKHSRYTLLQRQTYDLSNDFKTISTLLGKEKLNYKKTWEFCNWNVIAKHKKNITNFFVFSKVNKTFVQSDVITKSHKRRWKMKVSIYWVLYLCQKVAHASLKNYETWLVGVVSTKRNG